MSVDSAAGLGMFGLAVSIGIGLVFLTAGAAKLRHRALLEAVVANYRILPARLTAPVAGLLPFAELALGCALLSGVRPVPQIAAIALLLGFAAAMAVNIRRGRSHIDCGCGLSALRQQLGWPLVGRNIAMAAMLVPALPQAPALPFAGLIAAGIGGIALFLSYLVFNAIAALSLSAATAFRR